MADKPLIIFGAGAHGLVVAEAAVAAGWDVRGFRDDNAQHKTIGLWPVVDESALDARNEKINVIVAIGDNKDRNEVCDRLARQGCKLVTVTHPTAWVSPSANVGRGVYIGAMAVVQVEAHIGDGAIVNTQSVIEHHCRVGDFAHVAPNAGMGGRAAIGEQTLLGLGAVMRPGATVGDRCTVGAGAVIISDIADDQTVMGVPARPR